MKYQFIFIAMALLLSNCTSSSNDKEKELLERENAVLKKELELQKSQAESNSKKQVQKERTISEKQLSGPDWNYSGLIGEFKVKFKLIFEQDTRDYWNPVTGYYYYEGKNELIVIKGDWNEINSKIHFYEYINDSKNAYFEGKFDNPTYKKVIAGTWKQAGKSYGFTLNAK